MDALFGVPSFSIGPRRFKSLLRHISQHKPYQCQLIEMNEPVFVPKTLYKDQIKTLFDACKNTRDFFLLKLPNEAEIRIGQALSLCHEGIIGWDNEIHLKPRVDNKNGARCKSVQC